jgi:hypothetical protein
MIRGKKKISLAEPTRNREGTEVQVSSGSLNGLMGMPLSFNLCKQGETINLTKI